MAREIQRLNDRQVRTTKPKGKVTRGDNKGKPRDAVMLCDGGGLYLQVTLGAEKNVRRSWIFRYRLAGRPLRDMGIGSLNDIGLADAREIARKYRNIVKKGKDPIKERDAEVAGNLAASAIVMTFDEAAKQYIAHHRHGWRNPIHAAQWPSSLKTYASPVIGKMSVADIDTPHVSKVLDPIWHVKPETANRVRGRIEAILGWATVKGYRNGDNPARWRGHLANVLTAPGKVRETRHQAAIAYADMPAFMAELRTRNGMAALALEFLILTSVRTSDVRHAKRTDIDLTTRMWNIPKFSKIGKPHRVPLSDAAVAVVEKAIRIAKEIGGAVAASEFLFPNDLSGAPLSENAMLAVLDRMGRKEQMTAHGCRASFRTWAQEATNFPWELAEMSLGHNVGDKVERAYARGDGLQKRKKIMQSWADYCAKPPPKSGNLIPFKNRSG